jgi:nucleoside 2-deoxyribosyltransferase
LEIKAELENNGHVVELPNSFDNPESENEIRGMGNEVHAKWKEKMFDRSIKVIEGCDAVLVLNFDKNEYKNYIGGATFLEMYDAFRLKKKIFLYNQIPEGILMDEIIGFAPIVIEGNLERIK